jgi:hypothetical protein
VAAFLYIQTKVNIVMKRSSRLDEYFALEYIARNNPAMMKELVKNPRKVLQQIGLHEDALRCPDEVHKVIARTEKTVKKMEALGEINPIRDLPKIAKLVGEAFGEDFLVSKEPFGVRFSEPVTVAQPGWTITGTIRTTFGSSRAALGSRWHLDVDG